MTNWKTRWWPKHNSVMPGQTERYLTCPFRLSCLYYEGIMWPDRPMEEDCVGRVEASTDVIACLLLDVPADSSRRVERVWSLVCWINQRNGGGGRGGGRDGGGKRKRYDAPGSASSDFKSPRLCAPTFPLLAASDSRATQSLKLLGDGGWGMELASTYDAGPCPKPDEVQDDVFSRATKPPLSMPFHSTLHERLGPLPTA